MFRFPHNVNYTYSSIEAIFFFSETSSHHVSLYFLKFSCLNTGVLNISVFNFVRELGIGGRGL